MSLLSKEKRVSVEEKYFKRKSYVAVQATFGQRFNYVPPCKKTVQIQQAWIKAKKIL